MERYFNLFGGVEDVVSNFGGSSREDLNEAVVIAAIYTQENYEGSAMVVYRKSGKLYEVHGSHCSCFGLEEQWNPEETTYDALYDRLSKTKDYTIQRFGDTFEAALMKGLVDEMFDREVLEN